MVGGSYLWVIVVCIYYVVGLVCSAVAWIGLLLSLVPLISNPLSGHQRAVEADVRGEKERTHNIAEHEETEEAVMD